MIKPLRIAACAIFVLGLIGLASCNRRTDADWRSCFSLPSKEACPSLCGPCMPSCDPCCKTPRCFQGCPPSCKTPRCFRNNCDAPCANPCPAPCGPQPCGPCRAESNPYFPTDPSLMPCGNGNFSGSGDGSGCGCVNTPLSSTCGTCLERPFPQEVCFGSMQTYQTCDDCVVDLCQVAPQFATVGSPYPVEIYITARKECAYVKVEQTLPCDSVFVKSDPETYLDENNRLHWEFPHLTQGEQKKITVWVKPMKEGCCLAAATICACPQLCAYTNCGQPVICIKKCGPACACLYCPITYVIDVCNTGSAVAYDVRVQDTLPEGLTHASGYRCLNYELGSLCPGESRRINLDVCASKRGTVTNTAAVSYCGGPKCVAEATTIINEPCVTVTKTGPDWSYICKPVEYTITVCNPGDLVLRNMVVDDISPAGTTVMEAPGAEVCCNRATWCIDQICPGETMTFKVVVCSQVAGCLTNKVSVTTQSDCGPCSQCAEATTLWRGLAASHMCMVDTCDPICVGQTTVYRICVTNRGTAEDTNVQLSVNFTNELEPQCVNGPTSGRISGNTVTFDPIPVLGEKASCEFCITVKGVGAGHAKAQATLTSDSLDTPNTQIESTHVY